MKKGFFTLMKALALCGLLGGCTFHLVYFVTKPAQANPGDTISVYVFTAFVMEDTTRNFTFSAGTDSVLVSAALPSGWSVLSAEYFIDPDVLRHFKLNTTLFDSANARRIFDSLKAAGDVVTASRAAQYDGVLNARYDSANVRDQFVSFLGLRGFHVPAGTPADTSGLYQGDSIYIKLIASCTRFVMTCGPDTGAFKLGFFTGYDPGNRYASDTLNQYNTYDDTSGILITNGPAVERRPAAAGGGLFLSVFPNPARVSPDIEVRSPSGVPAALSLFDPNGKAVWTRPLGMNGEGWTRVSPQAKAGGLAAGAYVLRLEAGNRSVCKRFVIAR